MSVDELQQEELEVLRSIYEGDSQFREVSPTAFQYKYGEEGMPQSFVLEIHWGKSYPNEKPIISMDAFYNKHIVPRVKKEVVDKVEAQSEMFLGCAMTYSLFEWVKENLGELTSSQPEMLLQVALESVENVVISDDQSQISAKKPKRDQMTKAQKRKQWERMDGRGERPRGWDWVDIVKHLSQTGSRQVTDS